MPLFLLHICMRSIINCQRYLNCLLVARYFNLLLFFAKLVWSSFYSSKPTSRCCVEFLSRTIHWHHLVLWLLHLSLHQIEVVSDELGSTSVDIEGRYLSTFNANFVTKFYIFLTRLFDAISSFCSRLWQG